MKLNMNRYEEIRLISRIAGYTTTIKIYSEMLTGKRKIGRSSLAMAAFEGRDYLAEIRVKLNAAIKRRAALALEAREQGLNLKPLKYYGHHTHTGEGESS